MQRRRFLFGEDGVATGSNVPFVPAGTRADASASVGAGAGAGAGNGFVDSRHRISCWGRPLSSASEMKESMPSAGNDALLATASTTIEIRGLDKVELLRHLHMRGGKVDGGGSTLFDDKEAMVIVNTRGFIGDFCGKWILTDLSASVVEFAAYDLMARPGTFMDIVMFMRRMQPLLPL